MLNWKLPHWAMVGGATFAGAALAYVKTSVLSGHVPSSLSEWESLAIGAAGTGLAAAVALYVKPPVTPPATTPESK